MLDLAQIEADQVEFESVSFDLVQLCQEAVDSFQPCHLGHATFGSLVTLQCNSYHD